MVGILESGTVTIKNRQTRNTACLPSDDDGRSLHTKPNDDTDIFKWIVDKLDNDNYILKNLETRQFAYVSPPPKEESLIVAKSDDMEWRIVGTEEPDVYWIAPTDADYFWGVSSSVSGTPIELRKGRTDRLNHWMIKSITASPNSADPYARVSSTANDITIPHYVTVQAGYDSHPDRTPCLENTRTEILETILAWVFDRAPTDDMAGPATTSAREQPIIFWLNGLAGTGRTTIAYTVAQRCHDKGVLGASFFCSRSIADCNNPLKIFPTIAYQLASFYPPYRDRLTEILQNDPSLLYSSITRQLEELILKPLASLRADFPHCLVVIDALDECNNQQVTSAALSTLLKNTDDLFPLRLFITSRPEFDIVATFSAPSYRSASGQLLLHEVALELVTADIRHFLETSLLEIWARYGLVARPAAADVDALSRLSGGLFIFAATAVKFIGDRRYSDPSGQLEILISKAAPHGSHTLLDDLYLQVLDTAFPEASARLSARLKSILGSIVLIKDPLPAIDLSHLIELRPSTVYSALRGLHSVLVVPESEVSTASIHLIHPTFAEFLLDSTRCTSSSFAVDSKHQHTILLRGCLNAMRGLKRDICDIRDPSVLNIEVPDLRGRMAKAIPSYLAYTCHHWPVHLSNGDLPDEILDALVMFAQKQLLYWVEACSLLGIVRDAISGLNGAHAKLMTLKDERARKAAVLFNDCERLIIGFFPSISSSALQLYHSVLSLVPRKTVLAKTYAHERRPESSVAVIRGVADSWDACLGTMIAHGGTEVWAVDFSPDGKTVVSSGANSEIRLWDALTCTLLLVLSGHTDSVRSVKYSPDGTRIVSAADDRTIKIWDAVSGVLVRILERHRHRDSYVGSVAVFTPDSRRVISGSDNCTIKIWDAQTGTCLASLSGHQYDVKSIAVSPDGLWMASYSSGREEYPYSSPNEREVHLWSLEVPYAHRVLTTQGKGVAFSRDGSEVLVASHSTVFEGLRSLWGILKSDPGQDSVGDMRTGQCLRIRTLKPSSWSGSFFGKFPFAVSPAGDEFVYGLQDRSGTSVIYSLSDCKPRRILTGHGGNITCIAYNYDGNRVVSGSWDGSIRLWDVAKYTIGMAPVRSTSSDSLGGVTSPDCDSAAFYHDGSRSLCVICSNGTIKVEGTDTRNQLYNPLTLFSKISSFNYATLSPDGSAMLVGEDLKDWTVTELWDATTGSLRTRLSCRCYAMLDSDVWQGVLGYMPHSFGGHSSPAMFSQDSQYLVTGSHDGADLRVSSVAAGKLIRQFVGHKGEIICVAFSLDANRVATCGSQDNLIIIWDTSTGVSLATCKGHGDGVSSAAFSPVDALVVSGGWDCRVRVWNADTGESLQSFSGHSGAVESVAFTPAGDVVISFSCWDYTMRFWDVGTGDCLQVFHTETWGRTIDLAPDGTGIIVGGGRHIQLWSLPDAYAQPSTTLPWLPRRSWPVYYIEDGWVFSLTPTRRRRLCWVPVDQQKLKAWSPHTVVLKGHETILDFTRLNNYLDSLDSALY